MGSQADKVTTTRALTSDEHAAHERALSQTRALREVATNAHRSENHHAHFGKPQKDSEARQQRIDELAKALPGMRSAGLASLNPRMGTCGSLPDLKRLRGREGIDAWRMSTPWALGVEDVGH